MSITHVTGDLFTTPGLDALGHGVNCIGRMGAGIAAEFRRRYPAMWSVYSLRCRRNELRPGGLFAWDDPSDGWIYNLATQHGTGPRATLPAIQTSVQRMLAHARAAGVRRIGLPRIGCGLGGLDWTQVRRLLETLAAPDPDIDLVLVSLPGEPPC